MISAADPSQRVKQSGMTTIDGDMAPVACRRSSRSSSASPHATVLSHERPPPANPASAKSTGYRRVELSYPGGR
jgi:hypothetical protein